MDSIINTATSVLELKGIGRKSVETKFPEISVDTVTAYIPAPNPTSYIGRMKRLASGRSYLSYFWIPYGNASIGIRRVTPQRLSINFNPSKMRYGHNLLLVKDPLSNLIKEAIEAINGYSDDLNFDKIDIFNERVLLPAVGGLHLYADFRFDDYFRMLECLNIFADNWGFWRNRKFKRFETTAYFKHSNWDLAIYDKTEETFSSHRFRRKSRHLDPNDDRFPYLSSDIPLELFQNRLRFELRLRRSAIGHLLQCKDFISLSDGINKWNSQAYRVIFDWFLRRFRPFGSECRSRLDRAVPLYPFLASWNAVPTTIRPIKIRSIS